ncbi:MAG: carbohydrate kinase family protein [Phycisphaeraceae bacterium]
MAEATLDCVVAGSCVVDLLCRPVRLDVAIGAGVLHQVEPMQLVAGGITSNAGVTMARLGLKVAILSYVGRDAWAPVLRDLYRREDIDDAPLATHPTGATSTTVVAIAPDGERSFFHCVGAPKLMTARTLLDQLPLLSRSRFLLLGYYSLMPNLESDLAEVLREVRATGCRTAMDAAGDGGGMQPLERLLPHLDVWVPSLNEARHQTGHDDPRKIIAMYRDCGAPGLLGVKLGGTRGVLMSPAEGEFVEVASCAAPGPVVDTTGAGDCFYGGLLAGLINGLSVHDAGRMGAAAAACCVTSMGGSTGGRGWEETARMAGVM